MGENESTVFLVGGTSIDIIRQLDLDDLTPVKSYQKEWGMGPLINIEPRKYLILIQHPVTTEYEHNFEYINETITVLRELRMPTLGLCLNMDAGADGINKAVRRLKDRESPDYIHFFKSLPIECYAPVLKNAACILGNSSSGIREAAYLGTPTVNIGSRQNGRARGRNVIDVGYNKAEILKAVKYQIKHGPYEPDRLYGDGYAAEKIVKILRKQKISIQKTITY